MCVCVCVCGEWVRNKYALIFLIIDRHKSEEGDNFYYLKIINSETPWLKVIEIIINRLKKNYTVGGF